MVSLEFLLFLMFNLMSSFHSYQHLVRTTKFLVATRSKLIQKSCLFSTNDLNSDWVRRPGSDSGGGRERRVRDPTSRASFRPREPTDIFEDKPRAFPRAPASDDAPRQGGNQDFRPRPERRDDRGEGSFRGNGRGDARPDAGRGDGRPPFERTGGDARRGSYGNSPRPSFDSRAPSDGRGGGGGGRGSGGGGEFRGGYRGDGNRGDFNRGDSSRFRGEDRGDSRGQYMQYERPERTEPPAYGYYDGDHVYGANPVKLALTSKKRTFSELLIQTGIDDASKKDLTVVNEILELCEELNIAVREFSKHDLNMLTDSRPHQGFVLRASPREFIDINTLPPSESFKCVLVLDEVWDPQNFGALLRTSHYLGCDKVVACAKNSAPLSPTVSKASSGAMEVIDVYSTVNLMKFLDNAKENGWQVVGTALSGSSVRVEQMTLDKPTILVLGNEGHGIRTNILRRCDVLVKIPSMGSAEGSAGTSETSSSEVDSLNVSVTGGILLHHILSTKFKANIV